MNCSIHWADVGELAVLPYFWELWGEVILWHVPAHMRHLHSWAHGPSFLVKTNHVSSSNLSDLGFYVNIYHV